MNDNPTDFQQSLSHLTELLRIEENASLEMGDILLDISQRFGKRAVADAADICHLTKQAAYKRVWLASRFPPDHSIRRRYLTYSHLCVLARLSDEIEIAKWADLCEEQQWPASRLVREMEIASDEDAQAQSYPCVQCNEPLPDKGVVAFTIGGKNRRRCCGIPCTINYLTSLNV